ncbi:MAG: hypothetical protein QXL18_03620, partial [Candidatus Woesearchaeota archaeon]
MKILINYKKHFAIFSIYLLISLIFITSNSLAVVKVSGENLVDKWRKLEDITIFYTNDTYNYSIELSSNQWTPMICNQNNVSNITVCEYFVDKNIATSNIINWRLRKESESPQIIDIPLKVDSIVPKIESLNITNSNGRLEVRYIVRDYSSPNSQDCSGLDYIIETLGSETKNIEFNTTKCVYEGVMVFNETNFFQQDFPITILAYDRLGQYVSNTTKIKVDFLAPEIEDEWQIMRGGQIVETFSTQTNTDINYDIIVYVNENELKILKADLSELNTNPALKNVLKNKQATCNKETDQRYKCTFTQIPVRIINSTIRIFVNAYDNNDNFVNKTLQKTITTINNAGETKYIGTLKEHCTQGLSKCYSKKGLNTFIAEVSLGSNISTLVFGFNTEKKVGPCFLKEDKWECIYKYNIQNNNPIKVYIDESSRDNYGNKIPYAEKTIYIDDKAPVFITNITSNLPSCAVASDTLELTFNVKEDNLDLLKTYVNTSGLTGTEITNGECSIIREEEWACKIKISGFVTEHLPENRKIIVEDLAGNTAEKIFRFEVCSEDPNVVPNYINKVEAKEITIDRRTASIIPVKTFIPLTITKSNSGKIIGATVDSCNAIDPEDNKNSIDVLDSGHYIVDNNLVLYIGFDGAKLPEDDFKINCTLNFRIRSGNKVFYKPEKETVIIKVKPYNNPIGTLDSATIKKIAEQKAAIRDIESELKSKKSVAEILGSLCNLAQIIVKINNILQLIKSTVYAVCVLLASSVVTAELAESIWSFVGTRLNSVDKTVQKHVWPTNILTGSVYGNVIKYTCLIYTCQHYKVSGLIEIGSAIIDISENAKKQKEEEKQTMAKAAEKGYNKDTKKSGNNNAGTTQTNNGDGSTTGNTQQVQNNNNANNGDGSTTGNTQQVQNNNNANNGDGSTTGNTQQVQNTVQKSNTKKDSGVSLEEAANKFKLDDYDYFTGTIIIQRVTVPIDELQGAFWVYEDKSDIKSKGKLNVFKEKSTNAYYTMINNQKTYLYKTKKYSDTIIFTVRNPHNNAVNKVVQDVKSELEITGYTGIRTIDPNTLDLPDSTTGGASKGSNNKDNGFDWGTIEKGIDDYYARNMKFYSALESED